MLDEIDYTPDSCELHEDYGCCISSNAAGIIYDYIWKQLKELAEDHIVGEEYEMANQHVNKVVFGNNTLIDLTADTATEEKVLAGYTFHKADGKKYKEDTLEMRGEVGPFGRSQFWKAASESEAKGLR